MLEKEEQLNRSILDAILQPFNLPFREYQSLAGKLTRVRPDEAKVIRAEMDGLRQAMEEVWINKVKPKIDAPEIIDFASVQFARHPQRPSTLDYVQTIFTDFMELHGDRRFGDDKAIVSGPANLDGKHVMIIGTQKGRDARENSEDRRRFGMPRAEGYRKALRLMKQAEKFQLPVITFVDLPGASPDAQSEERGIALSIAENISTMSQLETPIIAVITGQGGSGGALALAAGDRLLALEYSYFSVVSPEGAASILWRDASFAPEAARQLQPAARNLPKFISWTTLVEEPPGGAHCFPQEMYPRLKKVLIEQVEELSQIPTKELLRNRHQQFRGMGQFFEPTP